MIPGKVKEAGQNPTFESCQGIVLSLSCKLERSVRLCAITTLAAKHLESAANSGWASLRASVRDLAERSSAQLLAAKIDIVTVLQFRILSLATGFNPARGSSGSA